MTVIQMRGAREAPRGERSKMETLLLTPDIVNQWQIPPFQRPLKRNARVLEIADKLCEEGGIISGIITLGTLPNDRTLYLMDGQHRRLAALESGLSEFIADVRIMHFDTMAKMAVEYVKLNSNIVRMNADDVLRGMEGSLPPLQVIRRACPFVGYGYIRANPSAPIVGMSSVLRLWNASSKDTPTAAGGGSAMQFAEGLVMEDAEELIKFLKVAYSAWSSDIENSRLWASLNLGLCMWLWRTLVSNRDRRNKRYVLLTVEQFKRCLMSVSAEPDYVAWLSGRNLGELHRSPCFKRLRAIFTARLRDDGHANTVMPKPLWVS